jgi:cation diffusion facilitator CzcD-associated flavoprotein CzcO
VCTTIIGVSLLTSINPTGYFGLAAARQYRWLCPDSSLAILESETSLGGSFADHRLYPGLKSNNLLGTFEYGDFPMNGDEFGVKSGGHIPGEAINRYLKMYAKEFGIAGLIQFDTKVLSAEHQDTPDGGWVLTVADSLSGNEKRRLYARRLIVSTGLTSQPLFPHFEGQETFGGPVFHTKDFLYNRDTILQGSTVTVLGGGKSAWDAVYTYATAGVKVNWVISCEFEILNLSFISLGLAVLTSFVPSNRSRSLLDDSPVCDAFEEMD